VSDPAGDGLKILLVEDHDDIAEMMLIMLRTLRHEGTRAATVAAAVEALRKQTFDLMIVDYSLPDGTGPDLMKQIKHASPPKAILLTAYGKRYVGPIQDMGFADLLEKPVEYDQLREAIDAATRPSN
jgi:two-component system response regulator HydG